MVSVDYNPMVKSGSGGQNSGIVDMWGPGAKLSPFGNIINVVLVLKLIDGLSELDAHTAIRLAQCRVAQRLAETTKQMTPEDMEVFELFDVDPSLPRVVYDLTFSTTWHEPVMALLYYGLPIRESLATFVHPNEFIDGALTVDARRGSGEVPRTWEWMNNPVVLGLLREHGKQLNFLGVILQRTRFEVEQCKHVGAQVASQMASLLHADAVIVTKTSPSGNNSMDVIFTVQACENKGIKTVFITPEYGGAEGTEQALWFYAPEADAVISTGSLDRGAKLSAPTKVIGCEKGELVAPYPAELISPWSKLDVERRTFISGGIDYLGLMRHTCKAS
jgi:glycine reductase